MENHSYKFLLIFLIIVSIFFVSYFTANLIQEGYQNGVQAAPFVMSSPQITKSPSTNLLRESGNSLESSPQIISGFHSKANLAVPTVQVQSALIEDLKTKNRYFTLNIYRPWPLASLTKIMTAVITMQKFKLNDAITINQNDLATYDPLIKEGSEYSVEDLIKMMVSISSNTAANALANHYGFDNFINLMNDQASRWGMWQTHFKESIGLSPNNISSASDLEKLVSGAYQNYPLFFDLSRYPEQKVTDIKTGAISIVPSINDFAGQSDFLGGKTGSTDEAQGNLASIFSYQGRPILIIVLGTNDRFSATRELLNWFENSYTLQ